MANHKLYVYGTLMPTTGEKVQIPGDMFDLGWFPGARIMAPDYGKHFNARVIQVDDARLKELDAYEGYDPDSPALSLYIRRPYLDGWIYEYNRSFGERPVIESGDWEEYILKKKAV